MRRFSLVLFGFMIGQMMPVSSAQEPLGFSKFDWLEMQMENAQRVYLQEQATREQIALARELEKDRADFKYTMEMAVLWNRLGSVSDEFYQLKWNQSQNDTVRLMEIRLLKAEIERREKLTKEHLKKR